MNDSDTDAGCLEDKKPYQAPAVIKRERLSKVTAGGISPGNVDGGDGPAASDIRLKREIEQVGALPNGIKLYRFRYLWSEEVYVGVMAQEVLPIVPDAVIQGENGYYEVDYALLGTRMMTNSDWLARQSDTERVAA